MKILLDFVINHSGYKHEWFTKSIDRIDPYTDFYVWIDSKGYDSDTQSEIPPNRWVLYNTLKGAPTKLNTANMSITCSLTFLTTIIREALGLGMKNENNSITITFYPSNQIST